MDRVFLDANVLFSAAHSPNSALLRLWRLTGIERVSSLYAVDEAIRNLASPALLARLKPLIVEMELVPDGQNAPALPDSIELPDKDQPILRASIGGRCTHLITGDRRHFGKYFGTKVEGVLILTPAEYLRQKKDS